MRLVLSRIGETGRRFVPGTVPVLLWVTTLLCSAGCADRQMETRTSAWPDGSLKEEWNVRRQADGSFMREGSYRSWHLSGRVYEEGEFRGDQRAGTWRSWYDTEPAAKNSEGAYVEGEKDGPWEYWMGPHHAHVMGVSADLHPADHMCGSADRTQSVTHAAQLEHYRLGVPHGTWLSWYPGGQIADSVGYENGQLEGRVVSYHENGRPAALAIYRHGVRLVGLTMWDKEGNVL